jgi:hypothetical protein
VEAVSGMYIFVFAGWWYWRQCQVCIFLSLQGGDTGGSVRYSYIMYFNAKQVSSSMYYG